MGNKALRKEANSGVSTPQLREALEKWFLTSLEVMEGKEDPFVVATIKYLKSGGHVFDERGVLLEEYQEV